MKFFFLILQKIFPTVFGPKYDSALQALMRTFLCSLQKLLPVPNLEEVSTRHALVSFPLKKQNKEKKHLFLSYTTSLAQYFIQ